MFPLGKFIFPLRLSVAGLITGTAPGQVAALDGVGRVDGLAAGRR